MMLLCLSASRIYNTFSISTRSRKKKKKIGSCSISFLVHQGRSPGMMLLCLRASRIYNTLAMKSTLDFKMFFLEGTELFFPDSLFDTAFLINFLCRPRMMTWLRENWRLYHIRCEIRSEIKGIGNVASYWVSSWDSWLLLSYLSWILRVFFGC